nr:unnamed protein product [Callosobruchus analis]
MEEKHLLLHYKFDVLEQKLSNYDNMDDRSSSNSTNDIQTRSTRGATNRPGRKLNVKELSTTAKKPSSESASTVEQYRLEPGMTAAKPAENTCSTSSSYHQAAGGCCSGNCAKACQQYCPVEGNRSTRRSF